VRQLAGLACTENIRAVGHLQRVGHMTGGRCVKNRLVESIPGEVQYLGDQYAAADGDRFAGLEVYLHTILFAELANRRSQLVDLVAGPGDVVPAAEIHPLHRAKQVTEFLFDGLQGALEGWKVLFAQGVKMQPADSLQDALIQL